jgi:hypothetical protein
VGISKSSFNVTTDQSPKGAIYLCGSSPEKRSDLCGSSWRGDPRNTPLELNTCLERHRQNTGFPPRFVFCPHPICPDLKYIHNRTKNSKQSGDLVVDGGDQPQRHDESLDKSPGDRRPHELPRQKLEACRPEPGPIRARGKGKGQAGDQATGRPVNRWSWPWSETSPVRG